MLCCGERYFYFALATKDCRAVSSRKNRDWMRDILVRDDDVSDPSCRWPSPNVQLTACVILTYISHQLSRNCRRNGGFRDVAVRERRSRGRMMGGSHEDIGSLSRVVGRRFAFPCFGFANARGVQPWLMSSTPVPVLRITAGSASRPLSC